MSVKVDGTNGLLQNYDYQAPTTGFSYTFLNYNVLVMNPAGTLATGTITMPAAPVDGMTVTFSTTQAITALTVNANSGQSIVGGGSVGMGANTSRSYMYRLSNTTWYLQNVVTSVNGNTGVVTSTTDVQTFNSTATWTKPTGGQTMARIQLWGGGGGGGRSASPSSNGGGGGGGYNEVTLPLSYLAATVTATVGGGGTGATSSAAGASGGNSSFALATPWNGASTVYAYGGGGGGGGSTYSAGGGGGGQLSAGAVGPTGIISAALPGNPQVVSMGTGGYANGCTIYNGSGGFWHGGGGAGCNGNGSGGSSVWGGGGGAANTAGTSVYGGAGGAGVGGAGTAPGGGGGCTPSANQNGGNGAAGRIVITCW